MGYLYTASNPHAPLRDNGMRGWYYTQRQGGLSAIRVIGVHTAETDPTPNSAEAVAKWQRDRAEQPSSYHVLVDSDSTVRTLPDEAVAFHIRSFNTPSLGLSFATRARWWGNWPTWDDLALKRAAAQAREWVDTYSIPLRWLRKTEAESGMKGFVRHSTMDPDRRTDPGLGFPAEKFFELIEGDDVPLTDDDIRRIWEYRYPTDENWTAQRWIANGTRFARTAAHAIAELTKQIEAIEQGDGPKASAIAREVRRELAQALEGE